MEQQVFDGLMYLAKYAKLTEHQMNEFRDIICDHEFEDWNDGFGNIWDKCKHCGKLQVKDSGI